MGIQLSVPNEATTNAPSDAGGRYFPGLYEPGGGLFYAPRANGYTTVLASAARTATPTIATFVNPEYRGATIVVYASAASATPSVVVTVKGVDPVSLQTYSIDATNGITAAITGTGLSIIKLYPGLTNATPSGGFSTSNAVLPFQWTLTSVHGDADSLTYSIVALLEK